jgi:monoamine oxidase
MDGPPGLSIDITPPDGKPGVLSAYIFGPRARHSASVSQEERKKVFLDGLVKRFGPQAASPVHHDERDWAAQEFSRGDMFAHYPPAS